MISVKAIRKRADRAFLKSLMDIILNWRKGSEWKLRKNKINTLENFKNAASCRFLILDATLASMHKVRHNLHLKKLIIINHAYNSKGSKRHSQQQCNQSVFCIACHIEGISDVSIQCSLNQNKLMLTVSQEKEVLNALAWNPALWHLCFITTLSAVSPVSPKVSSAASKMRQNTWRHLNLETGNWSWQGLVSYANDVFSSKMTVC